MEQLLKGTVSVNLCEPLHAKIAMLDLPLNLNLTQKYGRTRRFSDSKSVYFGEFLICFLQGKITFSEKPEIKINSLQKLKYAYLSSNSYIIR